MSHVFPIHLVERAIVTLRLQSPLRPHFLHGGVIHGLLCRALDLHPLPPGILVFACESGRVEFAAGDEYRFGVTAVGDDRRLLVRLEEGLARIGSMSRHREAPAALLQGNFDLLRIESDLSLPMVAAAIPTERNLTIQFVSPLRMQRPREDVRPGKRFLDADCFPAHHFLSRYWQRMAILAGRDRLNMPDIPKEATTTPEHLLWIDMPIKSRDEGDRGRPSGYTLGGTLGGIAISQLTEPWCELLALGSILHAGEKTHYGFGRFVIREVADLRSDPLRPSRTAAERLADPELLRDSLAHVTAASEAAGVDGVRPVDVSLDGGTFARALGDDLKAGTYRPRELLGFAHPKPTGGLRALAVPTVRDRCAQRAACALLGPAVDSLLEDCSYAYRKGFSRSHAAAAIRRAYEQGYRYVLDADIEGFFDAVDWARMAGKLRALLPYEPLVEIIEQWMAAPVVFNGRRIARQQGLPQGAPISPLLANLFLDEFDEELLGRDYRLIRYADDFVVLCRDLAEAERARSDAQSALLELGLQLHDGKTSITTFDAGFSYLGFLFCRSLVVEHRREAAERAQDSAPLQVPRLSWLAQVPMRDIRAIMPTAAAGGREDAPLAVPLSEVSPVAPQDVRPLYISGPRTHVSRRGGLIVVEREDEGPVEIPAREVSHVVLIGPVNLTMPVLLSLAREQIPVYACHASGELDVPLVMQAPDWRVWARQGEWASEPGNCLAMARAIVQAKLHNSATIAIRFRFAEADAAVPRIRGLERAAITAADVDALRGLEGKGAALFFAMLRDSLPPEWGFRQRLRQPPPDPINAMLSYGYTLLYGHVSTALVAAGLNPREGFFHREHGAYHALACDLQEEFRHLVDALVWAMVQRSEVRLRDFSASDDGRFPCLMTKQMRRKFIGRFEERLAAIFRPLGRERETSYREFLAQQAKAVRELVDGRRERYEPLRIHA